MASNRRIITISKTAISFFQSTVKKSPSSPVASNPYKSRSSFSILPYNNVTVSRFSGFPCNRNVRFPPVGATRRMMTTSMEKVYKWSRTTPMTLTYYTLPTENIVKSPSWEEIRSAFRSAFARWSEVIPVDFAEVDDSSKVDIKIGFYRTDEYPFNEKEATMLACADYPQDGEVSNIYMKAEKLWAVDLKKETSLEAFDLESIAVHEIGHVLGLDHSKNRDSVMYPYTNPRSTWLLNLRGKDAKRAQKLYGSKPNFDLSILE